MSRKHSGTRQNEVEAPDPDSFENYMDSVLKTKTAYQMKKMLNTVFLIVNMVENP